MFNTPKKPRGGYSGNYQKNAPLKGLFKDGIWLCNCDPRLPASHFQVKKEGPNKGKWFYTCQESKESGCGFFLWDDAAVGREKQVVMKNSRSEVDGIRTPADASRDERDNRGQDTVKSKFSQETTTEEEDGDEFGDFPFSPEDVASVMKVAELASAPKSPETPSKKPTNMFATPAPKRKWDEAGLLTPSTGGTKGKSLFGTPARRLNGGMWDGNEPFGSKNTTPTRNRFRDPTDPESQENYDITAEVMDILQDQKMDEETNSNLRQLLSKHALKIAGVVRNRDISRAALKTKDLKIAELQQRITALEREREMDKTVIKHFKNDMSQSVASRKGRGRGKS
ncbi:hypothetical protein GLAREA_05739 [Glarea lozoyensis ATCC 20868]|uniref:GRF-type domain-containing protein n=1 Tax=Glarea lozoyensis (strain ATCC 20868 / MF5171) TaxID=1116229 RepID=S3DWT2_GLAL2|nr:uncharacterized protein GLAREA_05739 [Glarea lozoyensis ATCC 20868]EPE36401.1 hypothetical protein GLAREA_05739 [Glarea lozoyensis ATCC 20868]